MIKFKSLAPTRIASKSGHVVTIMPEGTDIPEVLEIEARAKGCVPVAELEAPTAAPPPLEADKRDEVIKEAIELLMAKNDPNDFTKTEPVRPKLAAVRATANLDDVTGDDILRLLPED